jgi:hypothetical protein
MLSEAGAPLTDEALATWAMTYARLLLRHTGAPQRDASQGDAA